MSWSPELPIGEFRPWPDTVHVVRGRTGEMLRYVPERTCRNISPKLGNNEFTCEECLARVYGSGGRWFDANWDYHKFNYCPNCGRKVV